MVNDTTLRARLSDRCGPGDAYLVDLRTGRPVRERHPQRFAAVGPWAVLLTLLSPGPRGRAGHRRPGRPVLRGRRLGRSTGSGFSRPLAGPFGLGMHGDYLRAGRRARADSPDSALDLTAFKGAARARIWWPAFRRRPGLAACPAASPASGVPGRPARVTSSFPLRSWPFGAEARWREMSLDRAGRLRGIARGFDPLRGRPATPSRHRPQRHPRRVAEPAAARRPGGTDRARALGAARGGHRHRDRRHGPALSVRRHRGGRRRVRLLRTDPARLRPSTASPCRGPARSRPGGTGGDRRSSATLAPGDLLTFSNRGGPVSHVGLYVGEGRFIHSASRGVQVSVLSADDPYGRWWYQRWVGVRRIIGDEAGTMTAN